MFKAHFERAVNPTNLAMLINAYIHRTDLNIARTPSGSPQASKTLKMPVINVTGALSPHADDTVTLNGRLDPTNSTWMKVGPQFYCTLDFRLRFSVRLSCRSPTRRWCSRSSRGSSPKHFACSSRARDTVSSKSRLEEILKFSQSNAMNLEMYRVTESQIAKLKRHEQRRRSLAPHEKSALTLYQFTRSNVTYNIISEFDTISISMHLKQSNMRTVL